MLITLLLVCALCAAIAVPVAADADDPVTTITTDIPVTFSPVTATNRPSTR